MDVLYERCCGLDLHKRSVTACVLMPGAGGRATKEVRSFATMTDGLLALGDWLAAAGVTHVAMESTGVYWKPIWNLFEERFTLLLVNAAHVKVVPGRKRDVGDAEWLADLLRHGLLRGSFVPDRAARELRELTRYRSALVRERTAEVNRLQKTLEGANLKLASVVSDVTGVSARAMLAELVAGQEDAAVLADLAVGQLRKKLPDLERALTGRMSAHQRFMLAQHLARIDGLDEQIAVVGAEIADRLRPFEPALALLDSIPGIGRWSAEVIVAEIGTDMGRFPTAGHLASWAGVCPGHHESAGKRRSGKTRKGSPWLRVTLTEAAYAAGRSKDTVLSARYHRLIGRRGKKKAAVAVGRTILELCHLLLSTGQFYDDQQARARLARHPITEEDRLVRRLEQLGHRVTLEPAA
ncbi:MAG TPA: IS110 family transposase [Methylomirabilota bacterium]|nr:IS110 family transposase [Methylomirabilota bacterium]